MKRLLIAFSAALATACSHAPTAPMEPVVAPPAPTPAALPVAANGTILRDMREFSLFEDNRPSRVGDTLMVVISENVNASKKAKTTTDRKSDISFEAPILGRGIPGAGDLGKLGVDVTGENKFSGGGETSANNLFSGTITTLVTDMLPNGYLVITGTKQIALHGEMETLKFSGIVNPRHIQANGSISSQQVAEVRVKYEGAGQINESQFMGWLSRFFLNVLPL